MKNELPNVCIGKETPKAKHALDFEIAINHDVAEYLGLAPLNEKQIKTQLIETEISRKGNSTHD